MRWIYQMKRETMNYFTYEPGLGHETVIIRNIFFTYTEKKHWLFISDKCFDICSLNTIGLMLLKPVNPTK